MGVKHLWKALKKAKDLVGIEHMRNKTVAVDINGWLCESENTQEKKQYLSNLFWRVRLLQRNHVKAIFVLEGSSPAFKHTTLEERAEQSRKFCGQQGASGQSSETIESQPRIPSAQMLQECCELLDCLGVPYLQARGESDATCALLNRCEIVDSCITNDGDSFLFGTRQVYRKFNKRNADDGSVEFYDMSVIEETLNLNRHKLIALALLAGCAYDEEGVKGIGKALSLKLLHSLPPDGVLERLRNWKNEDSALTETEMPNKKCRKNALKKTGFPNEEIIELYLNDLEPNPTWKNIQWKRPDFLKLKKYMSSKLDWDDASIVCNTVPLLTVWDIEDMIKISEKNSSTLGEGSRSTTPLVSNSMPQSFNPKAPSKMSRKDPLIDVQWKHIDGVPDEFMSMTKTDDGSLGMTTENYLDMQAAFPDLFKVPADEPPKAKRKSTLHNPSSAKQLRMDNMFKVKKQLNFAAADKDVVGTTSSRS